MMHGRKMGCSASTALGTVCSSFYSASVLKLSKNLPSILGFAHLRLVNVDSPWKVRTRLKLTHKIRGRGKSQALGSGIPQVKIKNFPTKFPGGTDAICLWGMNLHRALGLFCSFAVQDKTLKPFLFFSLWNEVGGNILLPGPNIAKVMKIGEVSSTGKSHVWLNTQSWGDRAGAQEVPAAQAGFVPILFILLHTNYILLCCLNSGSWTFKW